MSDNLPDNGGYVAAAYLVFLALILIYVAIMAIRVARVERDLQELHELIDRDSGSPDGSAALEADSPEGSLAGREQGR